jgi:hypothetical protein
MGTPAARMYSAPGAAQIVEFRPDAGLRPNAARAVQLLLGHTKGREHRSISWHRDDDAIEIVEKIEV